MRSILIDRDGVINEDSPDYIRSPADFKPIPGSLEAVVRAYRAGFRIVVVSNQSGLSRGLFGIADLNAIHSHLSDEVTRIGGHIEAFFFCPHAPADGCVCRKPRAGLLLAIGERLGLDLRNTAFIGDRISDLNAARAAGARPVFVRSGPDAVAPAELDTVPGVRIFADLSEAIDAIIADA